MTYTCRSGESNNTGGPGGASFRAHRQYDAIDAQATHFPMDLPMLEQSANKTSLLYLLDAVLLVMDPGYFAKMKPGVPTAPSF